MLSLLQRNEELELKKFKSIRKQRQFIECLDDTDANSEVVLFKVKCYAGFGRMNIKFKNGDISL